MLSKSITGVQRCVPVLQGLKLDQLRPTFQSRRPSRYQMSQIYCFQSRSRDATTPVFGSPSLSNVEFQRLRQGAVTGTVIVLSIPDCSLNVMTYRVCGFRRLLSGPFADTLLFAQAYTATRGTFFCLRLESQLGEDPPRRAPRSAAYSLLP